MAVANAGDKVPLLSASLASPALVDTALFTVMIIVLVVTPSWAVMTVVITVGPDGKAIACDGVPDATGWPLTVIVAVASFAVGTTWILVTVPGTAAVKLR